MIKVKIPREMWHKVWKSLLQEGPVTRVSKDYVYLVSDRHLQILEKKQIPFEEIDTVVSPHENIRHLLASRISEGFKRHDKEIESNGYDSSRPV